MRCLVDSLDHIYGKMPKLLENYTLDGNCIQFTCIQVHIRYRLQENIKF